jgi:hypothetical protein
MTFALYRFGTLIARYPSWDEAHRAAIERGLLDSEGVEIVNESNQIDLEDAIEAAR